MERPRPGGSRGRHMLRFAEADTDFGNLHSEYCIRLCAFSIAFSPQGAGRIQLKALWGGQHRRPFISDRQCSFRSAKENMQFEVGDSKMKTSWRHVYDISSCRQYAIQSWRLQDDDIMATYIRHIILQAVCNSKSTTPR